MDSSGSSFPEEFVDAIETASVGFEESDKDLSVDDPLIEQDNDENKDWSPHNSFLADSPYFSAFVEGDVNSLSVLTDTLQDISSRTKTFSKCGALMAESTRRLATSCRLQRENDFSDDMSELERAQKEAKLSKDRRKAMGNEMADLLQLMGEVLEEIATAQLNMVNIFDSTLGMSLEAFAGTELMTVNVLKQEAEQTTEVSENLFFKYLNGKNAAGSAGLFGSDEGAPPPKSEPKTQMFSSRLKNWRSKGQPDHGKKNDGNVTSTEDSSLAMASTAANLRLSLEQIRLGQTKAELKRFQLLKHLVGIRHRRNFELCEGALASLHGMRTFFHHSYEVVQALGPRMVEIQGKEHEMRARHEKEIMPVWNERENSIIQTLDEMHEVAADASFVAVAVANGDPTVIDQQALALDKIEEQTKIWELPEILAKTSRYRRESPPGVIVEGWLYKKSATRMSLQPWHRRWFVMTKDAIFYYRTSSEIRKNATGDEKECMHTSQRVKIADIVLCTVRELPDDGNNRFCFEIITPNQKPLPLQSRGPKEYRRWVDAIRANLEHQLTHGDPNSDQLNKYLGKKNIIRESSNGASKEADLPPGLGDKAAALERGGRTRDRSVSPVPSHSIGGTTPKNPLVQKIMEANPTCADCGAASPDWVSLNLGVLVCLQCSGVHRSLGVHVSKVRSLTLDSLGDGESKLLLSLGNERANAFWEKGLELQKGWKKPGPDVQRKVREGYIKSKYLWKGFLAYSESDGKAEEDRIENFSRNLYEAAKRCDVLDMSEALAFGANVDWANSEEDNNTALHACVLRRREGEDTEWNAIECAELLYQHGARMEAVESSRHIYDFAVEEEAEKEMVDYLWTRITETERRDRLGLQLYQAAKKSDMKALAASLARGANVNWRNEDEGGRTPLHVCVLTRRPEDESIKWKAIECVELLLANGADLNALDMDGHNVMDCAVVGGAEREMIEFLTTKLL